MDMKEAINISLKCGVCGNTNFEYDNTIYPRIEDAKVIKCTVCNKVYTREEIIDANSTLINNTSEELVQEVLKKELKKMGFKLK